MSNPHALSESERLERNKKFWIVPGIYVQRKLDNYPIMSVKEISSKRVKLVIGPCDFCNGSDTEGEHPMTERFSFCEGGKLYRWLNQTKGVICQWIDTDGKPHEMLFQVKELKEYHLSQ